MKTLNLVFWIDCGYSHGKHSGKDLFEIRREQLCEPEEREFENLIPRDRRDTEDYAQILRTEAVVKILEIR